MYLPALLQHEYCESVEDFLERRTRLAFVDAQAALTAVPRVAALMAECLGWSQERRLAEVEQARRSLQHSFFCKAA